MNILTCYLLREFFKLFFLFVFGFIVIYIVFDIIENANRFAQADMTIAAVGSYMLMQIPEIISLLTPVAVLMATIISLGVMDNRNELVAIKSSGVSLFRFTMPILLSAMAISVSMALLNETVLPELKEQTNYIREVVVKQRPAKTYYQHKFWHKGHNSIYEIGSYDPENMVLRDVTYYAFDQEFNLLLRIDAHRVQFMGDHWRFQDGLFQKREDRGLYSASVFNTKDLWLPEQPDDFTRMSKPTSEMSVAELFGFIKRIEAEGYNAQSYLVDMHGKLSSPLASFVIAFLGIPLVLLKGRGRENHIARAIVLGSGLSLLYWVGSGFINNTLGYPAIIPAMLAAWLPNLLFLLLGVWLYSHVSQ